MVSAVSPFIVAVTLLTALFTRGPCQGWPVATVRTFPFTSCTVPSPVAETLINSPGTAGLLGVIGLPDTTAQHVDDVYAVIVTVAPLLLVAEIGIPVPAAPLCLAVRTTR